MIGVDTNILVYAHREEAAEHKSALALLTGLAEGTELWGVTWCSIYEFIRVVTHPKIFKPVTKLSTALEFVRALLSSPTFRPLTHRENHQAAMEAALVAGQAGANLAFDAQIAAIMIENGVKKVFTNDGDFLRFKDLEIVNPF